MSRLSRISGYQLILWWITAVCALSVACKIWPELDRIVLSLSDGSLIVGTALAVISLGWVAYDEIRKGLRRRSAADGQRERVRR